MAAVAEKLSFLEEILQRAAYYQLQTNISIERLSREMREFKNEMGEYKDWPKRQIITMNRQWGDLANKLGTFVEDIVAPIFPKLQRLILDAKNWIILLCGSKKEV